MADASAPQSLALFPVRTVLLPGAALGLRVFETRYLDMVRECGHLGRGFGVCLIIEGEEVGEPATPAAFGTEAVIEDFDTGDDGVLTLRVRGARRFHARRLRVRDNGLQVADIEWCRCDPTESVRPEHSLLSAILQRVLEHAGGEHASAADEHLDDAAWVGWRLAEFLPIQDAHRQQLLQIDDAHERLDRLLQLIDEV